MRKGVQLPDWIPEAHIIQELEQEKLRRLRELELEIEMVYPTNENPQDPIKGEERVIIIEL